MSLKRLVRKTGSPPPVHAFCSACYQPCLPSIPTDAVIRTCNPTLQDTPPLLPSPTTSPRPATVLTATLQKQRNKNCQLSNYKSDDFCRIFIGDDRVYVYEFYSFSNFSQILGWNVCQTKEATTTHNRDNRELICNICLISVFCPNFFVKL